MEKNCDNKENIFDDVKKWKMLKKHYRLGMYKIA